MAPASARLALALLNARWHMPQHALRTGDSKEDGKVGRDRGVEPSVTAYTKAYLRHGSIRRDDQPAARAESPGTCGCLNHDDLHAPRGWGARGCDAGTFCLLGRECYLDADKEWYDEENECPDAHRDKPPLWRVSLSTPGNRSWIGSRDEVSDDPSLQGECSGPPNLNGSAASTCSCIRQRNLRVVDPLQPPPAAGVSKDDFEAIVRRLDVELGYVSKHVGTHVRENDAFALELRAMLHER